MIETEMTETTNTPNARQIAGMSAERRILWLRILLRQKLAVRREHGRIEKEFKADFDAAIAAPVETDAKHHKANIERLIKLQELEAKIENNKALRAQKVAKVDAAFEAILFPKSGGDGGSQTEMFGAPPVTRLDPEVAATLQTALASAKSSTDEAMAKSDESEDGKKKPKDEWGHESEDDLLACERELAAFMAEMGVSEVIDPLSAAEAELDEDEARAEDDRVVRMPPKRSRTKH